MAAAFTLLLAAPARGQGDDPHAQALALFEQSERAYDRGDVAEAVRLLTRAYELEPAPVLLYNLARAHEGLGQLREAIDAYERYLAQEPDVHDRGALERRVETLRQQVEALERLAREAEAAHRTQPGVERASPAPSPWPWTVAGIGAAGLGVAVALSIVAVDRRDASARDPVHASASSAWREAQDFATAANATYAIAGGVTLLAALWGIIELATSGEPRSAGERPLALSLTFP